MANFECKGLDRLIKKIDQLSEVPEKLKKEIVKEGAETFLKAQKRDAPRDSGEGAEALAITDERTGEGYCFMDIGINADNWEKCKGLWFQNYDGERSSGKDVMWMQKSFKSAEKSITKDIQNKLIKEMDL